MARLQLAIEHNDRSGTVKQTCINMMPEKTPQGPREYALRGRPVLVTASAPLNVALGSGPISLMQQIDAVLFTLSDDTVYQDATALVGTVATGGVVQAAFTTSQSVLVSGYNAYLLGATVTQITDADLPDVIGVVIYNGYALFAERDSDTIWYSAFNDATDIDSLDFFAAEALPDKIVRMAILNDEVVVFGTNSIEFLRYTANPDLLFRRSIGRTQSWGCRAALSVVALDGALYFVGQDEAGGLGVFRTRGGVPERISSPTIDKALADAGADVVDCKGFAVGKEGNGIYVVTIPDIASYAYSIRANATFGRADLWQKWESYDALPWIVTAASGDYLGDEDGNVYTLDWDAYEDEGGVLSRTVSAYAPVMQNARCNVLELECATGVSLAAGQGSNAAVERRISSDIGGGFGSWVSASIGLMGDYDARVRWHQNGPMYRPGMLVEFRCTDPVPFCPFDVLVNEPR